jgi:hypothetical protein
MSFLQSRLGSVSCKTYAKDPHIGPLLVEEVLVYIQVSDGPKLSFSFKRIQMKGYVVGPPGGFTYFVSSSLAEEGIYYLHT